MEKLNGKIEFTYQFDTNYPMVRVSLTPDSELGQVLEAFEGFLRASGYRFTGMVDIVNDDEMKTESVN